MRYYGTHTDRGQGQTVIFETTGKNRGTGNHLRVVPVGIAIAHDPECKVIIGINFQQIVKWWKTAIYPQMEITAIHYHSNCCIRDMNQSDDSDAVCCPSWGKCTVERNDHS